MSENQSLLRVISSDQLSELESPQEEEAAEAPEYAPELVRFIRGQWEIMRNHRESSGIDQRLLRALRVFNGEYDPQTLAAIRQFGGSEVYSRIVGTKARGATALLRDIYFAAERPWELAPTDDPVVPDNVADAIPQIVMAEAQQMQAAGQPVDEQAMVERMRELQQAARLAMRERAKKEAKEAELRLNDILQEGEFYRALGELLVDVPLFPFVVLKGPTVRISRDVKYVDGAPQIVNAPKLFWERVSPFDFFWMPGAASVRDTAVCHRMRWSRKDLNDLIGLPGWDEDAIRAAIRDYDSGLRDWMTGTDAERAHEEDREDPTWNRSSMIDAMNYHGNVKGSALREIGMSEEDVPDEDLDYMTEVWMVGEHVLKTQINPSPRKRHPFRVTSFEKVPGTVLGHGLPDLLSDIGDVANAALRNLVNNMGLASGPQVVVNVDRLAPDVDPNSMYPWKRWMVEDDEFNNNHGDPISFFQPNSNASELLGIYQTMTEIADEISAIPRYITGSGAPGGAGRTASGLSMLMGNASKVLQQVAHNIDVDLLYDSLEGLYDLIMVTDAGVNLRGDENIVVKGVTKVIAKEVERARQLEFLGLTANPIDMQITGVEGRAAVLRAIADDLNLPAGEAVPPLDVLRQRQAQAIEAQQAQAQAEATGEGDPEPRPGGADGPITNTVQPNFNLRGN